MNDLKFTTAGDYVKDSEERHEPPEPCFMIEGEWAKDTDSDIKKENNEGIMGRKVSS